MRPICPSAAQRSRCHQAVCGWGGPPPHQGSWGMYQQHAPTSSAPPWQPKSWAQEPRERSAGQGSCPGFWHLTPSTVSMEVSQRPASRARLPSGSRVRVGPGEGVDVPAGASHAVAPPEPRARPGLRPPGSASVGGVRREREPRRAPPSGARGRWAREGCHPLTGGSIPPPRRGAGPGQRPHLPARRGPPLRPPSLAMPGQLWP